MYVKSIGASWPVKEALGRLTTRQPERFWTSGQWMTERQGGSDVGQYWHSQLSYMKEWRKTLIMLQKMLIYGLVFHQPAAQRRWLFLRLMVRTNYTDLSGSPLLPTQTWLSRWPECRTEQEQQLQYFWHLTLLLHLSFLNDLDFIALYVCSSPSTG